MQEDIYIINCMMSIYERSFLNEKQAPPQNITKRKSFYWQQGLTIKNI